MKSPAYTCRRTQMHKHAHAQAQKHAYAQVPAQAQTGTGTGIGTGTCIGICIQVSDLRKGRVLQKGQLVIVSNQNP